MRVGEGGRWRGVTVDDDGRDVVVGGEREMVGGCERRLSRGMASNGRYGGMPQEESHADEVH